MCDYSPFVFFQYLFRPFSFGLEVFGFYVGCPSNNLSDEYIRQKICLLGESLPSRN